MSLASEDSVSTIPTLAKGGFYLFSFLCYYSEKDTFHDTHWNSSHLLLPVLLTLVKWLKKWLPLRIYKLSTHLGNNNPSNMSASPPLKFQMTRLPQKKKKKCNFLLYYCLWNITSAKCNYLNAIFDIISANYAESPLWHFYQGKHYPVVSVDPQGKWSHSNGLDAPAISHLRDSQERLILSHLWNV